MFYGYEYFSGANVIVKTNGHSCLEAAAISYNYMDSKQPIYGYCSQMFDAVAPGQKLIQGSLVINYVYDNYLFDCIRKGQSGNVNYSLSNAPAGSQSTGNQAGAETLDQLVQQQTTEVVDSPYLGEGAQVTQPTPQERSVLEDKISALTEQFWSANSSNEQIAAAAGNPGGEIPTYRAAGAVFADPLSVGGGVNITIKYGGRGEYIVLDSVHFVGRASAIQIDENVIVEEYSFFARNLRGSPVML